MDAVEFLKAWKRMCDHKEEGYCRTCEARAYCRTSSQNAEKLVEVVEAWAKEHPVKTRKSEIIKMFPRAKLSNGSLEVCPKYFDTDFKCSMDVNCSICMKKYWLQEVE